MSEWRCQGSDDGEFRLVQAREKAPPAIGHLEESSGLFEGGGDRFKVQDDWLL